MNTNHLHKLKATLFGWLFLSQIEGLKRLRRFTAHVSEKSQAKIVTPKNANR
jgi:hypothetical protein